MENRGIIAFQDRTRPTVGGSDITAQGIPIAAAAEDDAGPSNLGEDGMELDGRELEDAHAGWVCR